MSVVLGTKVITVSNAVLGIGDFGFSAAQLARPEVAVLTARAAPVVVRWDGVNPTAGGHHLLVEDGALLVIRGPGPINALKFIRDGGVDATVAITLEIY